MKQILFLLLMILSLTLKSQIKLDPMIKLGYYPKYKQRINYIEDLSFKTLTFKQDYNFHYYTTLGLRVTLFDNFKLESTNQIFIQSNDLISNNPYSANFYLKAYYSKDKWKIGYEHLCIHFIQGSTSLTYTLEGGYDEIFISYNF